MNPRLLLALIGCNAIWATNPLMGKIVMQDFTPVQTGWLRYCSALLGLVFFSVTAQIWSPARKELVPDFPTDKRDWVWLAALGLLTFFVAPILLYSGLEKVNSSTNALLVAIEPLFCVALAWVLLRERFGLRQWVAILLSLGGFYLLSGLGQQKIQFVGSLLILLTMPCEAMHSIVSRVLTQKMNAMGIMIFSLLLGVIPLSLFLMSQEGLPHWQQASLKSILGVLWMGPFATAFGYVYWTSALRDVPIAPIVLTLLVQPIVGSINGYFILSERLTLLQFGGGLLILVALLAQTDWKHS